MIDRVDKRLSMRTNRPDIMQYIIDNNQGKEGMSRSEIDSNANLLMLAGAETSATALSASTWYLWRHPESLERLVNEIRTAFQREEDISIAGLSDLPYLHAVLRETLRLHPPGPVSVPRYVDRPVQIGGWDVPPGVCHCLDGRLQG